jgi:hypothetical protein
MGLRERALDVESKRRASAEAENERQIERARRDIAVKLRVWCLRLDIVDMPSYTISRVERPPDKGLLIYFDFEVDGIAFEGRLYRHDFVPPRDDDFQVSLPGGPTINSLEDLGAYLRLNQDKT